MIGVLSWRDLLMKHIGEVKKHMTGHTKNVMESYLDGMIADGKFDSYLPDTLLQHVSFRSNKGSSPLVCVCLFFN